MFQSSTSSAFESLTPSTDRAPTHHSPDGSLWIVDGEDGDDLLCVRRLTTDPGLLELGATLRHTGGASHPRLTPPTRWWKDGGHTWIASPRPHGTFLHAQPPARLVWSEAVDVITPLAIALRRAHRKGLVHARLATWNTVFDEQRHQLTALDFGTWPVDPVPQGPFRPPEMNPEAPTPTPATDIHNLTRLLLYIALDPDEARRDRPNFDTLPAYAISTLERALDADPGRRPATIDEFLAGLSFQPRNPSTTPSPGDSPQQASTSGDDTTTGRVAQLESFEHPERGPGLRFRLHTADPDDSPGVFVYRDQQPDVFHSLENLWDGAELRLDHPRIVTDSDGRAFLTATDHTLPVVEPHWPVSVSDVLKARGCPQRVMVDLRDPGERTHHLAFGTLIHQFLEDLTDDESLGFQEAVERRLPDLRLDFLASGVDDEQLSELLEDARRHFEHLRRFTARRTANASRRDRVGWCGEHAEATRYSSRYGLEGRTDLVVTDPEEGLQIIELKSGKPWRDHPVQVKSYALLWRTLADRRDLPTSGHLLYSKNGRMKRVDLDDGADERALLHGRNGLVTLYRSLIDPHHDYRPPHYMEQPRLCRQNACRFRRDRCRAQTEVLGLDGSDDPSAWPGVEADLVEPARQYHRHMTRLVEMERWSDHSALGAIFQPHRLDERIADGTAATELTLESTADALDRARLVGSGLHVFSPGDRILIHRGDIDTHHVFRARVLRRPTSSSEPHGDKQTLDVELRAATVSDHFTGPGWTADAMPSRIGYRTAHRALYRLLESGRDNLLDVLLRPKNRTHDQTTPTFHPATCEHLDDAQLEGLRRGLQPRMATLIHGPPGTGKTTVIAHICQELVARDQTVLLSALTNTAVDTMLVKLLQSSTLRAESPPRFLRLGASDRSPRLADAVTRHGLEPGDYFSADLAASTSSLSDLADHLEAVDVVATTAHSSIRHPVMTFFERRRDRPAFDVAVIDEASQLTEPMALAPISAAKRFVLVGDHHQLPPIVTAERALSTFVADRQNPAPSSVDTPGADDLQPSLFAPPAPDDDPRADDPPGGDDGNSSHQTSFPISESLRRAGVAGLDQSLFERLATFVEPHMLTTQYRMNRKLMAFPAETFYGGRLVAHDSVADHSLILDAEGPPPVAAEAPVAFVDVAGPQKGRTNPAEADILLRCAESIAHHSEATIGIISPFRAQVHLLRHRCRQAELGSSVEVDTVERFQGQERDVILASLVKTGHPGEFLTDARRLNVAMTRARKKLIIFGHRPCLQRDPTFRHWLLSSHTEIMTWNP